MELKELIEKAKQGDEYAFEELYNLTYAKAFIEAKSFMKNDDKAQEALQLAYIKISKNINQIEDEKTFYKWVNTIVANTCKDQLRKRNEFSFSDYEDSHDDNLAIDIEDEHREYQPSENTKYENDRDIILSMINELPTEQRAALTMQIYDEMKISEIATFFETSENTIKSRLNYAKKSLKEKVEAYKKQTGNTLFSGALVFGLQNFYDSYEESIVVNKDVYATIANEITENLATISTPTIAEETVKQSSKVVAQEATKHGIGSFIAGSTAAKAVIGVVVAGLVVGGGSVAVRTINNSNNTTDDNETVEEIADETINEETEETTPANDIASVTASLGYTSLETVDYTTSFTHDSDGSMMVCVTPIEFDGGYLAAQFIDLNEDGNDELVMVLSDGITENEDQDSYYLTDIVLKVVVYENNDNEWVQTSELSFNEDYILGGNITVDLFTNDGGKIFIESNVESSAFIEYGWFFYVMEYENGTLAFNNDINYYGEETDKGLVYSVYGEDTPDGSYLTGLYGFHISDIIIESIMSQDDSLHKLCEVSMTTENTSGDLSELNNNASEGETFGTIDISITTYE